MSSPRRTSSTTSVVVAELEGTLLNDHDLFPYFMLVAFEASGLIRFAILLLLLPLVRLLDLLGHPDAALRVMAFVAVAGVKASEIEAVSRAVLPKFLMEDVNQAAWGMFSSYGRHAVVTRCPRLFVERFLKEHLGAGDVVGTEIEINRFGYATGRLLPTAPAKDRVARIFGNEGPDMGLGRKLTQVASDESFLSLCKEQRHPPFNVDEIEGEPIPPEPVIFHDGRLVPRPTPFTSLLIILWVPLGVLVAAIRIAAGLVLPLWFLRYSCRVFGGDIIVRGYPPAPVSGNASGVLFVCNHRTLLDPVALALVLRRKVPAVTYSISRLSEIISPIPTIRLSRDRRTDADRIQLELSRGDLVVCPEGTTCREPFLLRFSALFAELTDRIVPVAMNYRVGFFHATTARGWKGLDPIFFMMNPRPVYEVTFLNQLPADVTCGAGRSPHDVANYVQRMLASTLGFECTNFTRKDKYRVLAGNDGTVAAAATRFAKPGVRWMRELLVGFLLLGMLTTC